MKSVVLFMAIMANVFFSFAQQDSTSVVPQHRHQHQAISDSESKSKTVETTTYNNLLSKTTVTEVRNDSTFQSSTLNINLPWFPGVSRSSSSDGSENSNSWTWTWNSPAYEEHISDLYFSFAFMADKNLPTHSVKSWEWGMYPLSGVLLHSRSYRSLLTWGLGFSRTSFKIKDQAPLHGEPGFTSQRFRYWSWRLPICAEFQSQNHETFVSLGLEAELRHHVRARGYGDALDHNQLMVVGHDKDLVNPWGCNVLLQAGTESCGLIARVALTDLFDQNATHLHALPFSIGFSLGF